MKRQSWNRGQQTPPVKANIFCVTTSRKVWHKHTARLCSCINTSFTRKCVYQNYTYTRANFWFMWNKLMCSVKFLRNKQTIHSRKKYINTLSQKITELKNIDNLVGGSSITEELSLNSVRTSFSIWSVNPPLKMLKPVKQKVNPFLPSWKSGSGLNQLSSGLVDNTQSTVTILADKH